MFLETLRLLSWLHFILRSCPEEASHRIESVLFGLNTSVYVDGRRSAIRVGKYYTLNVIDGTTLGVTRPEDFSGDAFRPFAQIVHFERTYFCLCWAIEVWEEATYNDVNGAPESQAAKQLQEWSTSGATRPQQYCETSVGTRAIWDPPRGHNPPETSGLFNKNMSELTPKQKESRKKERVQAHLDPRTPARSSDSSHTLRARPGVSSQAPSRKCPPS